MKLPVNRNSGVLALAMVLAMGPALGPGMANARGPAEAAPDTMGPAGDYPVTLGAPFEVDGVTYAPADTMNYDAVGKAVPSEAAATPVRISGAHRTLPVPSYVEVTSLDSGRTIVVRIDQRGPMSGPALLALSPMAWTQLGFPAAAAAVPVRVRRVNPPETERAALRTGQAAPQRMDTPQGLLAALRRKLGLEPPVGELPLTINPAKVAGDVGAKPGQWAAKRAAPPPLPKPPSKPSLKPVAAMKKPAVEPVANPEPRPTPAPEPVVAAVSAPPASVPAPSPAVRPATVAGKFFVQIGAFSQRGNAEAAARKAGGSLVRAGALWRVRSGPFAAGDEAERGLAKARAAGYANARIVRE